MRRLKREEVDYMCASCGCGKAEDEHGDPRNIKLSDLQAAAQAANTDPNTVIDNMRRMVSQSGSSRQQRTA
jgi:hypothetical protein